MKKLINYINNLSKTTKIVLVAALIMGGIGLLLQFIYPDRPPAVINISPSYQRGVPENSNFTITFGSILNEKTRNDLSFSVSPTIYAKTYWFDNNYQYYFQLSELMTNNTEHTITVKYKNKEIFSHTFITDEFSIEEKEKQMIQQGIDDQAFSQAQENLEKDFPFVNDVPIQTDQFVIVYDYDLEKFRIRLKVPESTNQEIKDNLENKALTAMKNKNIDPDQWGYYVLFNN